MKEAFVGRPPVPMDSLPLELWAFFFLAAIFLGFPVLMIIVGMWEKRPLKPLVAPAAGEQLALSPYHQSMNELADRRGFEFQGTFKHVKGGSYKLFASMWFSPDRNMLAVVAGGTMAKLRYRRTSLYTRLPDGTYVATSDEGGEADISGMEHKAFLLNADFDELIQHHLARVAQMDAAAVPFTNVTAIEAFEEKEAVQVARLESLGYLRFTDPARTTWRYSLHGAIRMAVKSSVLTQQKELKKQAERARRSRPGDSKYQPATVPAARPMTRIAQPSVFGTGSAIINWSFEGEKACFQAASPELLVFDPSALDALREALSNIIFPVGGATLEFMNELNSRFSVGLVRMEGFRPGMRELSPEEIRPCVGQPADDDWGVFAVNTGAVVLADYGHVLRLIDLLTWDTYETARQSPGKRTEIFASISKELGGPFFAVLKLPANQGLFRLDPRAVRLSVAAE